MPNFRTILVALFISILLASPAFSESAVKSDTAKVAEPAKDTKETKGAKDAKETKEVKEPTREDMIASIKTSLDSFGEIIGLVQGVKREADPSGKPFYTYQGKKLEDLDKEQLTKLYSRVNSEAGRLRADRLNKQLENIRRINQLNQQNRQFVPPRPVYRPPQPTVPPPVYNQPKQPPPPPPTLPRR